MKKLLSLIVLLSIIAVLQVDPFAFRQVTKAKRGVNSYLNERMVNPDSYEGYTWSELETNDDSTYTLYHDFNGSSRLGGNERFSYRFILNKDFTVIMAEKNLSH